MNKIEICALVLFFTGMFALAGKKNIIKTIFGICIMETAVVLFFLSINYTDGAMAPIGTILENPADPFVQALMITTIVIGISVTAFAVSLFIGIYHKYGASSWEKIKKAQLNERSH